MSELTICNFCSLQSIKQQAREKSHRVVLRSGWLGGVNVYVVPRGVKIPKIIDHGGENRPGDAFHKKYGGTWFMELTGHCVC